jgi:hypothetical protein
MRKTKVSNEMHGMYVDDKNSSILLIINEGFMTKSTSDPLRRVLWLKPYKLILKILCLSN